MKLGKMWIRFESGQHQDLWINLDKLIDYENLNSEDYKLYVLIKDYTTANSSGVYSSQSHIVKIDWDKISSDLHASWGFAENVITIQK